MLERFCNFDFSETKVSAGRVIFIISSSGAHQDSNPDQLIQMNKGIIVS